MRCYLGVDPGSWYTLAVILTRGVGITLTQEVGVTLTQEVGITLTQGVFVSHTRIESGNKHLKTGGVVQLDARHAPHVCELDFDEHGRIY